MDGRWVPVLEEDTSFDWSFKKDHTRVATPPGLTIPVLYKDVGRGANWDVGEEERYLTKGYTVVAEWLTRVE